MLELGFKKKIQRIQKIVDLHQSDDTDQQMLEKDWEEVFEDFDGWTIISVQASATGIWGSFSLKPFLCPEKEINEIKNEMPDSIPRQSNGAYSQVSNGSNHWIEPSEFDETSIVQICFRREHYGRPIGKEKYIEFNQLVTHSLGLHWSEAKQSLCNVNSSGEEVEKVKVIQFENVEVIVIRRKLLDLLLNLGKWNLIRSIHFSRWKTENVPWDTVKTEIYNPQSYNGKFRIRTCGEDKILYTDIYGAHILIPEPMKMDECSYTLSKEYEEEEEKYGNFIIQDIKNELLLKDYSLKPENFANFFTKSDKPFEMSPIFFKAEVLDKYKNNPDKYGLEERQITCRGGWHLQTYDINELNQVHIYAIYLGMLPYNEAPKSTISTQAFQTDFLGQFTDERSKMSELESLLKTLESVRVENHGKIWAPKGGTLEAASKGLHLVRTENPNQWHDFIIALTNTVNEGFKTDTLKSIALRLGNTDEKLRTLGVIKYILQEKNAPLISKTHKVLNDLQIARGKGKSHGTWSNPEGSLIEDSRNRLDEVCNAVGILTDFFKDLKI